MIIQESLLRTGTEYDMTNSEHPIPSRAIRYNVNSAIFEIYNYVTKEVRYRNTNLFMIVRVSNHIFDRGDTIGR